MLFKIVLLSNQNWLSPNLILTYNSYSNVK